MTSICEKKISAEIWLIHAEQMPLYNVVILRKNTMDIEKDQKYQVRYLKSTRIYWFF